MILYHVITTYHLMEVIVHKLRYKKNENAILLFPDFGVKKFPQYEELKSAGIFEEVILFPYEKISHSNYGNDTIKAVQEDIPYSLFQMSEIYVAGAQFYFSYYLIKNNILFYFFEEAGGNLSKPEDWIITMHVKEQREFALKYGLMTGENLNIIQKLGNVDAQKEGYMDPLLEDFCIEKELKRLTKQEICTLLDFFRVPRLNFLKNSLIIMSQHFAGLKMMTYEEQALMYSLVIDYFAEGYNLVFKCHPDDVMVYENIFQGSQIVREKFPVELLSYASEVMPNAVLSISSTGINNIRGNYKKVINFDVNFQNRKQYIFLHKYYVTNEIVKYIRGVQNVIKIGLIKTIADKFEELSNACEESPDSDICDKIIIVDFVSDAEYLDKLFAGQPRAIIFLNTNSTSDFEIILMKEKNRFVIKEIFVESIEKKSEYIYVYTEDDYIKKEIYDMKLKKKLNYSNLSVELKNLTDKDLEISILRGQLEAAEERLKYYIAKDEARGIMK